MEILPEKDLKLVKLDYVMLENIQRIKKTKFQDVNFQAYETFVNSELFFTQFDMALVQSAFFASLITFPKEYGLQDKPK